jgi:hypothetical protein
MKPNSYKEDFMDNRLLKDFQGKGTPFNYGNDLEGRIDFFIDNYHTMMEIYRAIVKKEREFEQKRVDAHRKLQNLRSNESRWKKTGRFPSGFNKDEHQNRKDYLVSLRERKVDITYNGQPIGSDMVSFFVVKHRRLFKTLDKFDIKVRGKLGFVASKIVEKFLWPLDKAYDFTLKHADTNKEKTFLEKQSKWLKSRPAWVNKKITTV